MPKPSTVELQFIEPMYALGVRNLPEGPEWLYEIKLDGYRCLAGKNASGVILWSRRENVFTSQFSAIAKACECLPTGTLVDGEIVATDSEGEISFNTLQHHRSKASAIRFYVFDLLIHTGQNMLNEPLSKRRDALTKLLRPIQKKSSVIELSQTVNAPASEMIRAITELGLEGIVAKREDSLYEFGKRSGSWVKYKINKGQEFVVGGYTPGNPFDAVIVGYYDGDKLLYAGKVRAGFVPHVRREVMSRMKSLETDVCPFANLSEQKRRTQWASGEIWSRESIEDLASTLEAAIAAAVSDADQESPAAPVGHITLMGHSFGGVLVRAAYLMAAGQYASAQQRSWWTLVDRIALFAAPNRGIEERRFAWKDKVALWWHGRAGQLTRDQLVGSPAITNLRIRWIRFFAQLDPAQRPVVVQFLGKGDEWATARTASTSSSFPTHGRRTSQAPRISTSIMSAKPVRILATRF